MTSSQLKTDQSIAVDESQNSIGQRVRSKIGKLLRASTVLVLFDQAMVSGSNFLLQILVVRACGEELFGIYHLGLTCLHYAVGVQNSLVCTPFTIQQAKIEEAGRPLHAGKSLANQTIISALAATVFFLLFVGRYFLFSPEVSRTYWAEVNGLGMLVLAVPMFLWREYSRRYCFARFEISTAIVVDAIASIGIIAIVGAMVMANVLTPALVYLAMACGCMAATVYFFFVRGDRFKVTFGRIWKDTLAEWRLGKWILVEQMLTLSCSFSLAWILYFMMDNKAVGRFAGLCMIINLVNPFMYGMANYLLPKYSQEAECGTVEGMRKIFWNYSIFSVAVVLAFLTFCITIGPLFIEKILKVTDFDNAFTVLLVICLRTVIATGNLTAHPGLLAVNRAKVSTYASTMTLIVLFIGSILLIPFYGLLGMAIAWLLSTLVEVTWRMIGLKIGIGEHFRDKDAQAKNDLSLEAGQ